MGEAMSESVDVAAVQSQLRGVQQIEDRERAWWAESEVLVELRELREEIAKLPNTRIADAQLIDAVALAEMLSTSRSWIYSRVERGEIPHVRIGGLVRFDPAQIKAWVAKGGAALRR
jgi:excisionase family DNA binding protein